MARLCGGVDQDELTGIIDSAGAYMMVRHAHAARLFRRRRAVHILCSAGGRMLWRGEFTASTCLQERPLAAGRVLGFLDSQETLRVIRLTG